MCDQRGPSVKATRRKIEDTLSPPRSYPKLNTPHEPSSPALTTPTSECTSHSILTIAVFALTVVLAEKRDRVALV
jgi:hypothetical protein